MRLTRLNKLDAAPRQARRTAFTLVELLVVIGIIAVLISILLPGLQQARRQANQVKCLAALKEIGNGLLMYGNNFKGHWPVAAYRLPNGDQSKWYAWTNLVAPYVSGLKEQTQRGDIAEIRKRSVIWGCPEWSRSFEYDPNANYNSSGTNIYTGYGMQYYPSFFDDGNIENLAVVSIGVPKGKFVKANVWGRNASERGVIADATVELIQVSSTFSRTSAKYSPFSSGWGTLYVDSTRHAKPGTTKKSALGVKAVNMLFADGHAEPVSIVEAWNAFRCPGQDRSTP